MTDLDRAIAAAREALADYEKHHHAIGGYALRDLLAALDAARGQAVAWRAPNWAFGGEWQYDDEPFVGPDGMPSPNNQPLFAAPPAALAVPAGYVPVSALIEAREEVESWAAYAAPYFQEKHDLAGTLAKLDAEIAQAQQPAAAVPADCLAALRAYEQADDSGTFVTVSREALDVAIAALTQQPAAAVPSEVCGCGKPADYMANDGGLCCNKYGIRCKAQQPAALAVPISWADFWMDKGDMKTAQDYAAFEKAEAWRRAAIAAMVETP